MTRRRGLRTQALQRQVELKNCAILQTGRFFSKDDTHRGANELLNWRFTVEGATEAHVLALERAPNRLRRLHHRGADALLPPDTVMLGTDSAAGMSHRFPNAWALHVRRGWQVLTSIRQVYDAGKAERGLGFRCQVDFGRFL